MGEVHINEIKRFFEGIEFTDDILQLDQCTTITNLKKFYESHIRVFENYEGDKKNLLPYYNRLLKLYYIYNSYEK